MSISADPKRHGSLSPEYALLGFLSLQPSHGYDLHHQLAAELGTVWHISQSQVYNILKRLETQGDIRATARAQEKLPPRLVLKITRQGRERFERWLDSPTRGSVRAVRLEFITRLYFTQKIAPHKIPGLLDSQTREIQAVLAKLERRQAELPDDQVLNQLSLKLRIRQLKSVMEWLDECRTALS